MSGTPPAEALRVLSRFLVADVPLGETLQQMADVTVDALPGADFAGIALLDEHERATTGVYTDPRAPKIDQSQYEGMLMANSPGMSADDAFDVLRKASQRENVKLREVAQRIVERRPAAGSPR